MMRSKRQPFLYLGDTAPPRLLAYGVALVRILRWPAAAVATAALIALSTASAFADTVHLDANAAPNTSGPCDGGFVDGFPCTLSNSASGLSVAVTLPQVEYTGGDLCYVPDTAGNQTTLTFTDGSTLNLQITRLCAKADPALGGLADDTGAIVGDVTVLSGSGPLFETVTDGNGTFAGTFSSIGTQFGFPSTILSDVEFSFSSYSLDVNLPPVTCTTNCGGGAGPGDTPELDSLALFGSGLFSLMGYLGLRRRARQVR
jgi:hypothetical protein